MHKCEEILVQKNETEFSHGQRHFVFAMEFWDMIKLLCLHFKNLNISCNVQLNRNLNKYKTILGIYIYYVSFTEFVTPQNVKILSLYSVLFSRFPKDFAFAKTAGKKFPIRKHNHTICTRSHVSRTYETPRPWRPE